MARPTIKTTRKEIAEYWRNDPKAEMLGLDWSDAHKQCWRCNYRRGIQRCHIVPHTKSANDDPSNLVLLCTRCHKEAPNVTDPEIMWDWLRAYCESRTEVNLWNQRIFDEYEFIYGESPIVEMLSLKTSKEEFEVFAEKSIADAVVHFGEGRLNVTTMVGLLRMFVKEKKAKGQDLA